MDLRWGVGTGEKMMFEAAKSWDGLVMYYM